MALVVLFQALVFSLHPRAASAFIARFGGAQVVPPGGPARAWGHLEFDDFSLEQPEDALPDCTRPLEIPAWFFENFSAAQLTELFNTCDLTGAQKTALLDTAKWRITTGGVALTPSREVIFGLSHAARQRIYDELERSEVNLAYRRWSRVKSWLLLAALAAVLGAHFSAAAEDNGALTELTLGQLSDRALTPLGQAALGIRAAEWKHAESANFVYHFFHGFIAAPVSVEAEFYYRVIARELEKDTTQWERKCHIYIFESPADWAEFQKRGALDPWTGGMHAAGSLFIQRDPQVKWKGSTLGHEVTHLVVERFFGTGVPLWLNEEIGRASCRERV